MKTLEEVRKEMEWGDVYTLEDFAEIVNYGGFIPYDGIGYFHDGEKETEISVWGDWKPEEVENFPYVCWYNN